MPSNSNGMTTMDRRRGVTRRRKPCPIGRAEFYAAPFRRTFPAQTPVWSSSRSVTFPLQTVAL